MRSALDIAADLERALVRLRASDDAVDHLVADGIESELHGRTFGVGVGLSDSAHRVIRQRDRERALVAIAATLGPGKANGLARQIAPRLSHYYGSGWLLTDSITHVRPTGPGWAALRLLGRGRHQRHELGDHPQGAGAGKIRARLDQPTGCSMRRVGGTAMSSFRRRGADDEPDDDSDLPSEHRDAVRLAAKCLRTAKAFHAEGLKHITRASSLLDDVCDSLDGGDTGDGGDESGQVTGDGGDEKAVQLRRAAALRHRLA